MSRLRKAAKGQECTIQLYPYCNGNVETTVLCHAPCEDKGMSIKSPDFWGADGCSDCHDVVDGRRQTDLSKSEIYEAHMRGVYRTLKRRRDQGLIQI